MILDQYPAWWRQSPETVAILEALGSEAEALRADLRDLLAQCHVETATWGLALWEQQVGIPTDEGKAIEDRRAAVLSRLRGIGTVTVDMIRRVAESFSTAPVEIVEDAAGYHFDVKFIVNDGRPQDLSDYAAAINAVKPAHLTASAIYSTRSAVVISGLWGCILYAARRCGTWPQRATQGGVTQDGWIVATAAQAVAYAAPRTAQTDTGTWPQVATQGVTGDGGVSMTTIAGDAAIWARPCGRPVGSL